MTHLPLWFSRHLHVLATLVALAANAARGDEFNVAGHTLSIRSAGRAMQVSLRSPWLTLEGAAPVGGVAPAAVRDANTDQPAWEATYPPVRVSPTAHWEIQTTLRWSPGESLLRKQSRVRLVGTFAPALLGEVVLDRIAVPPRSAPGWNAAINLVSRAPIEGPQSHPAFLPGRFVGVEYPVASTRREGESIVLAHRPGTRIEPGKWHETRAAVYGLTEAGEEVAAFERYIAARRPAPRSLHVNYNSWWTSSVPFTEKEILDLMDTFDQRLTKAHGVAMDTFAIDLGWSNKTSIWEIDPRLFPNGFGRIRDAARRMHSQLGLWISPSSYYPPALDGKWAKSQGYETLRAGPPGTPADYLLCCLGGPRYAERFRLRLADLVGRWGIGHLKFDGCCLECPEKDHGHAPGAMSSEAIAGGVIAAIDAARQANPQVWIETTCFGYNPSPWWLWHANSVIGTFGDDAPAGRVPCPVYRESYTTARDYFNLQGSALLPVPDGAQEVLGVVHQTAEPFTNDAIVTAMRGHQFLPLYVNPKFMDQRRWAALAAILRWTRANEKILDHTVPLLPVSWQGGKVPAFTDAGAMPREPYGYAHVLGGRGLVVLRNPWIAPAAYRLKLDKAIGFAPDATGIAAASLYPEPRRYGERLNYGATLEVPLAPYETIVLEIGAGDAVGSSAASLPAAADVLRNRVAPANVESKLQRMTFRSPEGTGGKALGPDWTCPLGETPSAVRWALRADIQVNAPQAELLLLLEGDKAPAEPIGKLSINGREIRTRSATSAGGWSATGLPHHEHWTFVIASLATGENRIEYEGFLGGDTRLASAWVVAGKPGDAATPAGGLPQPGQLSLGGASLAAPARIADLPAAVAAVDRPIERINGVFLDALTPASVKQGYGTLQKNQSVWEKPMIIGARRFQRGLGTHAPSKIVYNLDGKYRRFQTWAGADGNTAPTVTFEVRVDGVVRWKQGLTTRDMPATWVDLDIAGAKTLELLVGDNGELSGDHADWADARLLR